MLTKEVKVGLFTLISGLILYFGFNYLKGINPLSTKQTYSVIFDRVTGLQSSNPVVINGYPVGKVFEINLLQDQGNKLEVIMEIKDEVKLNKNTSVVLIDQDVLGGKAIELHIPNDGSPVVDMGAQFIGTIKPGLVEDLQLKAEPAISKAASVIDSLQIMISILNSTMPHVKNTIVQTEELVKENRVHIRETMINVKNMSGNLTKTQENLDQLLVKMSVIADSLNDANLKSTLLAANKSVIEMKEILEGINNGEGSIGQLVKSDELHTEMVQTLQDLDSLFVDLKANPARYVHFSVFEKNKQKKKKKKKDKE
ncbi:MlaD family protein [Sediminitomix flava]|uniref:Phospholipid/cholesterol/gamma-HCH transport system substrate-binding protein n=1 Tax=Sediminitomix flava TaxID=379075 RepID=A0A315ZH37_SEDFL|nr:MlaD family protein [Sediminitomix flava]PWJ44821.1 phospholipid/cholesterol/gamma-HCH transport system substrate-binding protein [Sediminitomix flava]